MTDEEKAERQKDAQRASRLKRKWKKKGQLSDDDHAWLVGYEARPETLSSEYTDAISASVGESDGIGTSPAADVGASLPPLDVAGVKPEAPPPPPSKKSREPGEGRKKTSGKGKGKGKRRAPSDWRSDPKYGGAQYDRETICNQLANAYCNVLLWAGMKTRELGGFAIPSDVIEKIIFPAAIACADDFLPDKTDAAPELVCAGAGGFQAFAYLQAKRKHQGEPIDVTPEPPSSSPDSTGFVDADAMQPKPTSTDDENEGGSR